MPTFFIFLIVTMTHKIDAKSITIQIDSDDLLNILKKILNINIGVQDRNAVIRSDVTKEPSLYINPYHPEDGINLNDIDEANVKTNNKTYKNKLNSEFTDKTNDKIDDKIDRDNTAYLQSDNYISDDEITDNISDNDFNKRGTSKNITLKGNPMKFTKNFNKRFIKKL
ncbi:uncharacterized protein LOC116769134 [Danaus plexippus]|uniref:uncharacterized protein LOC116769134 n=1 Tax=Danaus plexippus TaxID=13037 RepID=UPI002AB18795|nr:uncharacterized protein LOC116769134 [Danaus plexippus]